MTVVVVTVVVFPLTVVASDDVVVGPLQVSTVVVAVEVVPSHCVVTVVVVTVVMFPFVVVASDEVLVGPIQVSTVVVAVEVVPSH